MQWTMLLAIENISKTFIEIVNIVIQRSFQSGNFYHYSVGSMQSSFFKVLEQVW